MPRDIPREKRLVLESYSLLLPSLARFAYGRRKKTRERDGRKRGSHVCDSMLPYEEEPTLSPCPTGRKRRREGVLYTRAMLLAFVYTLGIDKNANSFVQGEGCAEEVRRRFGWMRGVSFWWTRHRFTEIYLSKFTTGCTISIILQVWRLQKLLFSWIKLMFSVEHFSSNTITRLRVAGILQYQIQWIPPSTRISSKLVIT